MNTIYYKQTLSLKTLSVVKVAYLFLVTVLLIASAPSFAMVDKTELNKELNDVVNGLGYSDVTAVKRLSIYRIDGFNAVNDESVIINSRSNGKYLVTLYGYCSGLQHALKIGTTMTITDVTKHDNIVVSNRGTGREVCPIQNIYKLEGKINSDNS